MFTLAEERSVEWPVKVRVAKDGKTKIEQFTATFRIPSIDEAKAIFSGARSDDAVRDYLAEHMSWAEGQIVDLQGAPIPCTDEAKAQLLGQVNALEAIIEAYIEAAEGGRRKN